MISILTLDSWLARQISVFFCAERHVLEVKCSSCRWQHVARVARRAAPADITAQQVFR